MMLNEVQGYLANLMSALGLKESADGFNRQNIPSYLLDKMFSIDIGTIQGSSANQMIHQFSVPVIISVYFKDYKNPNQLRTDALGRAQDILSLVLDPKVRLTQRIKDIRPGSISVLPLGATNDNSAILAIGFDLTLMFSF